METTFTGRYPFSENLGVNTTTPAEVIVVGSVSKLWFFLKRKC